MSSQREMFIEQYRRQLDNFIEQFEHQRRVHSKDESITYTNYLTVSQIFKKTSCLSGVRVEF